MPGSASRAWTGTGLTLIFLVSFGSANALALSNGKSLLNMDDDGGKSTAADKNEKKNDFALTYNAKLVLGLCIGVIIGIQARQASMPNAAAETGIILGGSIGLVVVLFTAVQIKDTPARDGLDIESLKQKYTDITRTKHVDFEPKKHSKTHRQYHTGTMEHGWKSDKMISLPPVNPHYFCVGAECKDPFARKSKEEIRDNEYNELVDAVTLMMNDGCTDKLSWTEAKQVFESYNLYKQVSVTVRGKHKNMMNCARLNMATTIAELISGANSNLRDMMKMFEMMQSLWDKSYSLFTSKSEEANMEDKEENMKNIKELVKQKLTAKSNEMISDPAQPVRDMLDALWSLSEIADHELEHVHEEYYGAVDKTAGNTDTGNEPAKEAIKKVRTCIEDVKTQCAKMMMLWKSRKAKADKDKLLAKMEGRAPALGFESANAKAKIKEIVERHFGVLTSIVGILNHELGTNGYCKPTSALNVGPLFESGNAKTFHDVYDEWITLAGDLKEAIQEYVLMIGETYLDLPALFHEPDSVGKNKAEDDKKIQRTRSYQLRPYTITELTANSKQTADPDQEAAAQEGKSYAPEGVYFWGQLETYMLRKGDQDASKRSAFDLCSPGDRAGRLQGYGQLDKISSMITTAGQYKAARVDMKDLYEYMVKFKSGIDKNVGQDHTTDEAIRQLETKIFKEGFDNVMGRLNFMNEEICKGNPPPLRMFKQSIQELIKKYAPKDNSKPTFGFKNVQELLDAANKIIPVQEAYVDLYYGVEHKGVEREKFHQMETECGLRGGIKELTQQSTQSTTKAPAPGTCEVGAIEKYYEELCKFDESGDDVHKYLESCKEREVTLSDSRTAVLPSMVKKSETEQSQELYVSGCMAPQLWEAAQSHATESTQVSLGMILKALDSQKLVLNAQDLRNTNVASEAELHLSEEASTNDIAVNFYRLHDSYADPLGCIGKRTGGVTDELLRTAIASEVLFNLGIPQEKIPALLTCAWSNANATNVNQCSTQNGEHLGDELLKFDGVSMTMSKDSFFKALQRNKACEGASDKDAAVGVSEAV